MKSRSKRRPSPNPRRFATARALQPVRVMLTSSSPARVERVLKIAIAAAIGTLPIAACSLCGGSPQKFDVTFQACADDDAGTCPSTCDEACRANAPAGRFGECADFDAGSVPITPGTSVTVQCLALVDCTGRKLDGLAAPELDWLARAAWLEASAIFAFRRLARELRAHGAPRALVRAARACARDEVRHARAMIALAKRRGATVPPIARASYEVRDLEAIAIENAVEGCVSETYGAAVAAWQGASARDPEIARVMSEIAPDELRHAAVGWAVHAWSERRLAPEARKRVREARDQAARHLLERTRELEQEHALATAIAERLWAA